MFEAVNDVNSLFTKPIDLGRNQLNQGRSNHVLPLQEEALSNLLEFCNHPNVSLEAVLQFVWHKIVHTYMHDEQTTAIALVSTIEGQKPLPLTVLWDPDVSIASMLETITQELHSIKSLCSVPLDDRPEKSDHQFLSLLNFETNLTHSNGEHQPSENTLNADQEEFPLQLWASLSSEKLSIHLNHSLSYLSEAGAAKLLDLFQRILAHVYQFPEETHDQISLASEEESHTQLYTWNQTDANYPLEKTVHQLFEEKVLETPSACALIFKDQGGDSQQMSYLELNQKSNQIAHLIRQNYLETHGTPFPADTMVTLYFDRGFEMVIGILAVLKAGGAYVAISPEHPRNYVEFFLKDTQSPITLTEEKYSEMLEGWITPLEDPPQLLVVNRADSMESVSQENLDNINGPRDLAYIIFTSGTTGNPKGVMVEHHSLVNLVYGQFRTFGLSTDECVLWWPNYIFDGSVDMLFMALLYGAKLLIPTAEEINAPEQIKKLIVQHQVTHLAATPTYLNLLGRSEYAKSLRRVGSAGEQCSQELKDTWKEMLVNVYGPTETTAVSVRSTDVGTAKEINRIGRPVDNAKLYVLDEQRNLLPTGAIGELYIGGEGVSRGYLNRPDLTNERFIENPFFKESETKNRSPLIYKSGDLVRWLPDGHLEYISRNDFQVKIRGYRIELGEIENALNEHVDIKQAAVLGPAQGNTRFLAAYVLAESTPPTPDQLRKYLEEKIPEYMVPKSFTFLDSFPMTINGKLDWRALPKPTFEHGVQYLAPRNEQEQLICQIWQRILGVEQIGIQDNFFHIGGNSIDGIRITAAIQEELGIEFPLSLLFTHKTIERIVENLILEPAIVIPTALEGACDLSFAQEGLFFIEKLELGAQAYHVPHLVKLSQTTNVKALEASITELLSRHAALRTVYRTNAQNRVYQEVLENATITLDFQSCLDESSFWRLVQKDIEYPFDLATTPALRIKAYHNGQDPYLLFVWHHIASDGWSVDLFMKELAHAYQMVCDNRPIDLPALELSYIDFVQWQREHLQNTALEKLSQFWGKTLSNYENLALPIDHTRPKRFDYSGSGHLFELDPHLSKQLRQLAKDRETTLFNVLLSGFYVTLASLSGQDDLVIGTPTDNRHHAQTQSIIGLFVNVLPLRISIQSEQKIQALFDQVHQLVNKARIHQELPFKKIIEVLEVEREVSRHPIFQVMFNVHDFGNGVNYDQLPFSEVPLNQEPLSYSTAQFDINLSINDRLPQIKGNFNYASSLFKSTRIEHMAQLFQLVLEAFVSDDSQAIGEINRLQKEERLALLGLTEDQFRTVGVPEEIRLQQLFESQVLKTPHATAIGFEGETLTYLELNEKANRLARYLTEQTASNSVGLFLERSFEMVIGIWGILKAGKAYVPIDPSYPETRIAYILKNSNIDCVLTQTKLKAQLDFSELSTVSLDDPSLIAKLAQYHSENLNPSDDLSGRQTLAYIIYTSGSTGEPKGVMVGHRAVANRLLWMQSEYHLTPQDVVLQKTPYSFDVSVWEFVWPMITGAKLVLAKPEGHKDPAYLLEILKKEKVTTLHFVPSMLQAMLNHGGLESCREVRQVFCSGEALPTVLQEQFFASGITSKLHNLYGPTEAAIDVSYWECTADSDLSCVPIGKPIQNTRLLVLDKLLQPVPVGVQGELYIGGMGLAEGYVNQKTLTEASFVESTLEELNGEKLYKTGDLVRWLPDTNGEVWRPFALEFLGRTDQQVKIRGFRIELGEIEQQLLKISDVSACAVVLWDDKEVPQLTAYYTASTVINELSHTLRQVLPDYMIPSAFVKLDEIPLTANGKIDRKSLLRPGLVEVDNYVIPSNEIETKLCQIWCQVLGLPKIGIHDNFFASGGDSILSIQVVSQASRQGLYFSVQDLFESQTISELSHVVSQTSKGNTNQELVEGEQSLSPIQQRFLSSNHKDLHHYNQSMLFQMPDGFGEPQLKELVHALVDRHDMLRLSLTKSGLEWSANYLIKDDHFMRQCVVSKSTLSDTELQQWTEAVQASLELSGPLVRFALAQQQGRVKLFVTFHHLIMDAVSWQIIIQDIDTLLEQFLEGGTIQKLPLKSSSFQSLTHSLKNAVDRKTFEKEQSYWEHQRNTALVPLPVDHQGVDDHRLMHTKRVRFSLDSQQTDRLLNQCHFAYRTKITDLLLSAVYLGVHRWSGIKQLRVDIESHGRDSLDPTLAFNDTVGWFTTLYPAILSTETPMDVGQVIQSVKEHLHGVPSKGTGYGVLKYLSGSDNALNSELPTEQRSSIIFNYLGKVDSLSANCHQLKVLNSFYGEGTGTSETGHPTKGEISLHNEREHQLSFNGMVLQGSLQIELDYNQLQYDQETIQSLAKDIEGGLLQVIDHCQSQNKTTFSPSDFPLASVSQQQLDDWKITYPELSDIYASTSMQQGLLYHHQKGDAGGEYISQVQAQFNGTLDSSTLRQVWEELGLRHEAFRTAFSNGGEHQLVMGNSAISWHEENLETLPLQEQNAVIAQYLQKDKKCLFDFTKAPLIRLSLFRLSETQHLFVITHHHCILDGWSMSLVLSEMVLKYRALVHKTEKPLPVPVYRDYIHWVQNQDEAGAKTYWQRILRTVQTATPIGIDKIPEVRNESGAKEFRWSLEVSEVEQLYAYARSQQTTANIVIQATWAYLLHRYSGENEVVFGAASSGRPANIEGIENTVGLMVNSLPVVVQFEEGISIKNWLKTIHKDSIDREYHGFLSLAEIRQCSQVEEGNPLFESLIGFQNYPIDQQIFGPPTADSSANSNNDLWIEAVQADEQSNYAITLMVEPYSSFQFALSYRSEQFGQNAIEQLVKHFRQILSQMISKSPSFISDLEMLSSKDAHDLVLHQNNIPHLYPQEQSIPSLFEAHVENTPNAIAVSIGQESFSYHTLNVRANQLAHYLAKKGTRPGDLIGLCLKPQFNTLVSILAILKAGGAYVPLDPAYPASRLSYMLQDSGIKFLITESTLLDSFEPQALSDCQEILTLDDESLLTEIEEGPTNNPHQEVTGAICDQLAYVIYTSGSTGQPKGTLVSHYNVVHLVKNTNYVELDSNSVIAMASNTSFDAATFEIWGALLNGGKLVHLPKTTLIDPVLLEKTLIQESISILFLTTALFNRIATDCPTCFAPLQYLLFGGEAVSAEAVKSILTHGKPKHFLHVYGPTECTTYSTWYPITEETLEQYTTVPIGFALSGTQLFVLDAKLRPQPPGLVGELYIGGNGIAEGYLNQPELTAQHFIPNTFEEILPTKHHRNYLYKTGDLVRQLDAPGDRSGGIEFIGRRDDQLKLRGFRIELGEIQATLMGIEAVQDAVVVTQEPSNELEKNKELVAYVVLGGNEKSENSQHQDTDLVQTWQALYDNIYSHSIMEGTFDITGWNSSFTGQAIPVEAMQEWQADSVSRLLALAPKRIYEIGCGTGLLLFQLLPHCEQYYGVDLSNAAIDMVKEQVAMRDIQNVQVWQGDAVDFSGMESGLVDTIIVNSVTQYLPNIHYLFDIILGAVKVMGEQGTIFIGDVVNFDLLEEFHVAVSQFQLSETAPIPMEGFIGEVQHKIKADNELYISPGFFRWLKNACPEIIDVKVQLKTGAADNEMNTYRYDVCLSVNKDLNVQQATMDYSPVDWDPQCHDLNWLSETIEKHSTSEKGACVIKNIPNARLIEQRNLTDLVDLSSLEDSITTTDALAQPQVLVEGAVHPAAIETLCQKFLGDSSASNGLYQITWSTQSGAKFFDLWLYPATGSIQYDIANEVYLNSTIAQFANDPSQIEVNQTKVDQIRQAVKKRLPDYMQPSRYVVVEALPLTPNGKVDKKVLKQMDTGHQRVGQYVAPRTQIEQTLCDLWQTLLSQDHVGITDNYFELGGHSLLATQLISAIRRQWSVDIPIKIIFDSPTIADLSAFIEEASQFSMPKIQATAHDGHLPLSFSQKRLCFIDQLGNAKDQYNMPLAFKAKGALNYQAFTDSVNQLVSRHSVLRTNIEMIDGQPYQRICPETEVVVQITDLSHLPLSQQEVEVARLQQQEASQVFDIAKDLKLRAKLLKLDEQTHVVLLTIHHIASDGWSIGILLDEISQSYGANLGNVAKPLPALPIQYADYSYWQRVWFKGNIFEKYRDYWVNQLAGIPDVHQLPLDFPRPKERTYQGDSLTQTLSRQVMTELNALANQQGASMFMVLHAAFAYLMFRYSGESDLVIGTPIAAREQEELTDLIGFFVNNLVLRSNLSSVSTFEGLIQQSKTTLLEAYEYQQMPYEMLVEEIQPNRSLKYNPLFQVVLSLQNMKKSDLGLAELEVSPMAVKQLRATYDLSLHVSEDEAGLSLRWEFATDLFTKSTIRQMASHFTNLLSEVLDQTSAPIQAIDLLSSRERDQLLNTWNETDEVYPDALSIPQVFEQLVDENPNRIALTFEGTTLTYQELNERSNQLAHQIRAQHKAVHGTQMPANALVALYFDRSLEMLISLLAVLKAGAAYVPISIDSPQERMLYMLGDTQAPVLLTQARHLEKMERTVASLPRVPAVIAVDLGFEAPSHAVEVPTHANDLAYVIYTSGSTGQPKGVMVEQKSVINHAYGLASRLGEAFQSVDFSTNYSFDLSVATNLCPLLVGGKIAIYSGELVETAKYHQHLQENGVHLIKTTPSIAQATLSQVELPQCSVLLGGETLPASLVTELDRGFKQVFNEYGPTEATVGATVIPLKEGDTVSIGSAFPNVRLYCLSETLSPVGIGISGELYIGGAGVARGYLNNLEMTKERFIENPFASPEDRLKGYTRLYKTGDLVRWLPDGKLDFIGRNDFQVKLRGFRIELGEIEKALINLPSVKQAVVVVYEQAGNKQLAAYWVPVGDQVIESDQLRGSLEQVLPDYMIPTTFTCMEQIPLTPNGKVDRRSLPEPKVDDSDDRTSPRTQLESKLSEVWQEILGLEKVGIHDNFFRIGGESILCIQLVSTLRQEGFQLQVKDVFESPTVAELAELIESAEEQAATQTEQGQLEGTFDLLPIQQRFFEKPFASPHHYNQAFMQCLPSHFHFQDVKSALVELAQHHDMLRCRFVETSDGFKQSYQKEFEPFMKPLKVLDASVLSITELRVELTQLQNDFNFEKGPLWQVAFITGFADGTQRLFFAFHHLIIDAVSCRIVADTMQTLLTRKSLPEKTSSYRQWSVAVKNYANEQQQEIAYWKSVASQQIEFPPPLPKVMDRVELSAHDTDLLLHQANQGYHTEINDLLLSGLALTLKSVFGRDKNHITLEGHGRENIDEHLDVSQTVGWFTTVFPVLLTAHEEMEETIIQTKEHLRKIPNKGLGFSALKAEGMLPGVPLPAIGFNYLGQLDTNSAGSHLADWQMSADECGTIISEDNQDSMLLNIYGGVRNGILVFDILSQLSVEQTNIFTRTFANDLQKVIAQGMETAKVGGIKTPSDYATKDLSVENLRNVQKRFESQDSEFQKASSTQKNTIRI